MAGSRVASRPRTGLIRAIALGVVVGALLTLPHARAEGPPLEVTARGGVYQDDDATRVVTTVAAIDAGAFERARLRAHFLLDIVSSASVDVVSAATGRWNEVRKEAGVTPSYSDGIHTVSASYRRSAENDWWSHTFALAGSVDLLDHNLTLGLGLNLTLNDIGRAHDANFSERQQDYGGNASLVAVASRNDIWSLTYALTYLSGYQASPYRFVRYHEANAGGTVSAPEVVPTHRLRHALVLAYNRHLFQDSALRSHARAYVDNWGVVAGTIGTEYALGLGGFEPALFVRGYYQAGARFYEDGYAARKHYMTADRELSTFWDAFAGLRLTYRSQPVGFFSELAAELKLTGFWFMFQDFSRLPERRGFTAELGLGGSL